MIDNLDKEILKYSLLVLKKREYSEQKLREKITSKFPEKEISEIIDYLKDKNYLSDSRFCESFISDKKNFQHWGPKKILAKLWENGISQDFAKPIISEIYPEEEQIKIAEKILKVREKSLKKDLKSLEKKQKLTNFLLSRGFDFSIISQIL